MNKREVGSNEEELAAKYLAGKGYFIIQKNYRVRQGEIDIVARDGETIVFVEVKYRKNGSAGHPLEAVNVSKQRQICKTALFYLNQNKINPEVTPIRFDVVGILGTEITHIENAFYYCH
jgi:putative endonuclease